MVILQWRLTDFAIISGEKQCARPELLVVEQDSLLVVVRWDALRRRMQSSIA
jgi:hypothetical protein